MIAARYEINPRLFFRKIRTSDMSMPHNLQMILPAFWFAGNELFLAG